LSDERTIPAYLKHIAVLCAQRIDGLRIKGAQRQADAAMHFFLGASVGLEAAGHEKAANHIGAVTAMLISVRGMDEVRRLAAMATHNPQPARPAIVPEASDEAHHFPG
jgi:hypothetical protein